VGLFRSRTGSTTRRGAYEKEMVTACEAALVPLDDDAVLALVREQLGASDAVLIAPAIPASKEALVRRAHAAHLREGERILVVYDDTVLGRGDEGIVITSRRVAWKNAGGEAQSLTWDELDPESLYAEGNRLFVGIGTIELAGDAPTLEAAAAVFLVLALSARVPDTRTALARSGAAPREQPTLRPTTPAAKAG